MNGPAKSRLCVGLYVGLCELRVPRGYGIVLAAWPLTPSYWWTWVDLPGGGACGIAACTQHLMQCWQPVCHM